MTSCLNTIIFLLKTKLVGLESVQEHSNNNTKLSIFHCLLISTQDPMTINMAAFLIPPNINFPSTKVTKPPSIFPRDAEC